MSEPIAFIAATARYGLPLLFAGQAQKEFFVNEALSRIDAVLHPWIEEMRATAPDLPTPGRCWIVAPEATGLFMGHEGELAAFDGSSFVFAQPNEGMVVRLSGGGSMIFKNGDWMEPIAPSLPSGGTVVDVEARGAIATLCEALRVLGTIS